MDFKSPANCQKDVLSPDETISWIKNNLTENTPLRAMYLGKKSDMFVMWGEALENKIKENTIDMETKNISNHIRKELIELGLESAVHHMYHTLPQKYKSNTPNVYYEDEDITLPKSNENSSTDSPQPNKTNLQLIKVRDVLQKSLDNLNETLETKNIEEHLSTEFLAQLNAMSNVVLVKSKFISDGREKVCNLDHILALSLSVSCTLNSIFDTLVSVKMTQSTITSKQMGKIVSMRIREAFETLKPTCEIDAIQYGWTGICCQNCGQYRVERALNVSEQKFMDHCVSCDHWQAMSMSETLLKIKN